MKYDQMVNNCSIKSSILFSEYSGHVVWLCIRTIGINSSDFHCITTKISSEFDK